MKNLIKKCVGNGMRKWEGEKGPPKNLAWAPRGLNPALLLMLNTCNGDEYFRNTPADLRHGPKYYIFTRPSWSAVDGFKIIILKHLYQLNSLS